MIAIVSMRVIYNRQSRASKWSGSSDSYESRKNREGLRLLLRI